MPDYKLTYFDFDGGRGEPVRIAFHTAGIAFEDNRISFAEFGETRRNFRFSAVPVLHIDGVEFSQSSAMSSYIGKMAGLYPTDPLQAFYCDEVLGAIEDLSHYIVQTFGKKGEELKVAREKLVRGWLTTYLKGLGELLERGGGQYYANDALTIADLKGFVQARFLASGTLDHVPTDIVRQVAPILDEHRERVAADPRVVAYYASRSTA